MSLAALDDMVRTAFPDDTVRLEPWEYVSGCGNVRITVMRRLPNGQLTSVAQRLSVAYLRNRKVWEICCAKIRYEFARLGQGRPAPILQMANGSRIMSLPGSTEAFVGPARGQRPTETLDASPTGAGIWAPNGRLLFVMAAPSLEVDYARDLDDAPTFVEALAALEAHKARRREA